MKKVFSILLIALMFLIRINNVFALEVKQESLSAKEKSSTITVTDEGIGDLSINPKIEFNEVGDFITYKLVLKNTDSNKYKIESVTDNNQNESIKVIFDYNTEMNTDNKEMLITLKYDKMPTNPDEALKNIKVTIKLIDEDNNQEEININNSNNESNQNENNNSTVNTNTNNTIDNNVKTGDNIKTNIWLLLLSLTVLCITITYLVKTKKYNKGLLSILLILTIIPTFVYANTTKEITFNINCENIKINVKHKVTLDSNGGTLPNDEVTIKHGEEIGTLPVPTPPEGKEFDGWYKDNTKIEDDYVVTGNETLVAKYKLAEYTITYNLDGGTVTTANPTSYTRETNTFILNNPTKAGYKFLGWTGSNGNTPQKEVKIEKSTTGNKEYTANWELLDGTLDISYLFAYSDALDDDEVMYTVEKIITVDHINVPSNVSAIDFSEEENGSVLLWFMDEDHDSLSEMYIGQIGGVKVPEDSSYLFYEYRHASLIDLSHLDISNVTDMSHMFYNVGYLQPNVRIIGMDTWDTAKVTNMKNMFESSTIDDLTILKNWNVSNVEDFSEMFKNIGSLTNEFAINGWNISPEANFNNMFQLESGINPNHPTFTKMAGTWSDDGTFIPNP